MSDLSTNFTGVLLPVFYVSDVARSLEFYRDICGFDRVQLPEESKREANGGSSSGEPPYFVRMQAGTQEFALHLSDAPNLTMGGVRHYFAVKDVDLHHEEVRRRGGDPTQVQDLPWMRLFSVTDPDGHVLFFQTPNWEWEARVLGRTQQDE